jgi:hypothetical protein
LQEDGFTVYPPPFAALYLSGRAIDRGCAGGRVHPQSNIWIYLLADFAGGAAAALAFRYSNPVTSSPHSRRHHPAIRLDTRHMDEAEAAVLAAKLTRAIVVSVLRTT